MQEEVKKEEEELNKFIRDQKAKQKKEREGQK